MKKWIVMIGVLLFVCGCNRGDLEVTLVLEGQVAPHDGFNVGPALWLEKGETVPVSGAVIRIEGLDPNDIFE